MKRAADFFVYLSIRLFLGLVGFLPRKWAHALCRSIATLVFWVDRKHRRIGLTNLRIAFPGESPKWRERQLLRSFKQLGDLAVEVSRLGRLTRETLGGRVSYERGRGLENYLEAKNRDGAVIFVTAHISAWELLPSAHALLGHPLCFVVRPLDNPFLENWVNRVRSRFGNRTIPKIRAMRGALKALRRSEDVGFLIDQNVQEKDGIFVPLFGVPASTTGAVARLALKTGKPIVAGFIYPLSRLGEYSIRFYPPLYARPDVESSQEIEAITAQLNQYTEEVIRQFPHCWLWGHRRFRAQPDGKDPYAGVSSAKG